MNQVINTRQKKPSWLRRPLPTDPSFEKVRALFARGSLKTVCQSARCPNIWECFSEMTATFLIMGDRCTRNCRFCAILEGSMGPPDPDEPLRIASAVQQMGLQHVVITSVCRDDLPDYGADCFVRTIQSIRLKNPKTTVEVLVPDFCGNRQSIKALIASKPDVIGHNIETVPRLYKKIRPHALYERSLFLLCKVYESGTGILLKSSLMLGLGEKKEEVLLTLEDLLQAGCRVLTMGQYLQPTKKHIPVEEFIRPEAFAQWEKKAMEMGFAKVFCGPFVRSSYKAGALFTNATTPLFSPT